MELVGCPGLATGQGGAAAGGEIQGHQRIGSCSKASQSNLLRDQPSIAKGVQLRDALQLRTRRLALGLEHSASPT